MCRMDNTVLYCRRSLLIIMFIETHSTSVYSNLHKDGYSWTYVVHSATRFIRHLSMRSQFEITLRSTGTWMSACIFNY
jgi:hypothetical protein